MKEKIETLLDEKRWELSQLMNEYDNLVGYTNQDLLLMEIEYNVLIDEIKLLNELLD